MLLDHFLVVGIKTYHHIGKDIHKQILRFVKLKQSNDNYVYYWWSNQLFVGTNWLGSTNQWSFEYISKCLLSMFKAASREGKKVWPHHLSPTTPSYILLRIPLWLCRFFLRLPNLKFVYTSNSSSKNISIRKWVCILLLNKVKYSSNLRVSLVLASHVSKHIICRSQRA